LRLEKENGGETMSYDRSDRGPREMHKITCSDCGNEAEVPFKPTEGRDVYCKDCFQKHRPPRRF
jgi:CxxC-x17-CxxC domain-containing protein